MAIRDGISVRPRHLQAQRHIQLSRRRLGIDPRWPAADYERRQRIPPVPRSGDAEGTVASTGEGWRYAGREFERTRIREGGDSRQRLANTAHCTHFTENGIGQRLD